MKRVLSATLVMALLFSLGLATASAEEPAQGSLAAALTKAMQDERDIKGYYEDALEAFPNGRLFAMLIHSEGMHISALENAAKANSVTLDVTAKEIPVPATLEEALAKAAELEQADIDLYAELLTDGTLPANVTLVFQRLKAASGQHLNLLQRAVEGQETFRGMQGSPWTPEGIVPDSGAQAPEVPGDAAQTPPWQPPFGMYRWDDDDQQQPFGQGDRWDDDDQQQPFGRGNRRDNGRSGFGCRGQGGGMMNRMPRMAPNCPCR